MREGDFSARLRLVREEEVSARTPFPAPINYSLVIFSKNLISRLNYACPSAFPAFDKLGLFIHTERHRSGFCCRSVSSSAFMETFHVHVISRQ